MKPHPDPLKMTALRSFLKLVEKKTELALYTVNTNICKYMYKVKVVQRQLNIRSLVTVVALASTRISYFARRNRTKENGENGRVKKDSETGYCQIYTG